MAFLRKSAFRVPTAFLTLASFVAPLAPVLPAAAESRTKPEAATEAFDEAGAGGEVESTPQLSAVSTPTPSNEATEVAPASSSRAASSALAPALAASPTSIAPGSVSLPQGAGKVQGMGESFSALLSTGTASYSVPFALLPARGGSQPSLALGYSSGAGNGVVGMGWNTGTPFIARQADRGTLRYQDPPPGGAWHPNQDRFVYNGAELVPICLVQAGACTGALTGEVMPSWANGWQYFRPQVEGAFQRLFWSPDHKTWRVQDKSGISFEFGVPLDGSSDTNAIENDPSKPARIFRWNLARAYDVNGATNQAGEAAPRPANVVVYRYQHDGGIAYPSDIYDTPPADAASPVPLGAYAHHTRLAWQTRADRVTTYRRGWVVTQALRLARVDITSKPEGADPGAERRLVRRYHLTYETGSHVSLLASVQAEGRCSEVEGAAPAEEANGALPSTACDRLPPLSFNYSHVPTGAGPTLPGFEPFDVTLRSMAGSPTEPLGSLGTELLDVNADGLADVLVTAPSQFGGKHGVYFNGAGSATGGFGSPKHFSVETFFDPPHFEVGPSDLNLLKPYVVPLDIDGDGTADLVHMPLGEPPVVFTPQGGLSGGVWRGRISAAKTLLHPDVDLVSASGRARVTDVDGDGLVDVVVSFGDAIETFFSLGRYPGGDGRFGRATWTGPNTATLSPDPVGFCIPHEGVTVSLTDPANKIADINGDGLVDIVRVQHGDFWYWPGRGNGFFGTGDPATCPSGGAGTNRHIDMTSSPQFFGPSEGLSLQDVNGDGLADAVVVNANSVSIWLNVNGTSWTPEAILDDMPSGSDRSLVRVTDLNGSGTADIVWGRESSYDYVDLTGGARPWLLTGVKNGLGQSTELAYSTSTAEMLASASRGETWSSTAPLVTHVIKRVTVRDNLGSVGLPPGAYVTEYRYRDPVYDGRERKFRGFRNASETKFGDVSGPTASTSTTFLLGECAEEGSPGRCDVSQKHRPNPREALAGLPVLLESHDERGNYLGTAHTTYRLRRLYVGLDGREVRHAFASASDEYGYDTAPFRPGTGSALLSDVAYELTPGSVLNDPPRAVALRSPQGVVQRRSTSSIDAFGNPTEQRSEGCVSGCATADETITTAAIFTRPTGDTSGWLWRTKETYVKGSSKPLELRGRTFFDYDGFARPFRRRAELKGTLPLARSHAGGGAVAPAPASASPDGERTLETITYNGLGQVTHREGPNGQCDDSGYEATYARFLTTETTYAGPPAAGSCGPLALVQSFEHDAGLRVPVASRGFNGELARADYDQFGRVVRLWQPDPNDPSNVAAAPSTVVDYLLPDPAAASPLPYARVHSQTLDGESQSAPSYRHSWSYVDGLGRTLITLAQADPNAGDGGEWVAGGVATYGAKGAPERTYRPFFWTGAPDAYPFGQAPPAPFARQRYDAFGRVVETFGLDGAIASQTHYHALSQDTWDAEDLLPDGPHAGTYASVRSDGHGRTTVTTERERVGPALEAHEVRIAYLPTGEPLRIERANVGKADPPVVRWLRYDSLGRRVLNVEPHTSVGFTPDPNANPASIKAYRYAYDDSGRLVGTSDARGCGANYHYEAAGRLVAEDLSPCENGQASYTAPDLTTGEGTEVYYRYDEADPDAASAAAAGCATNGGFLLGKNVSIASRADKSLSGYDGRGRPVCQAKRVAKPGAPAASLSDRYTPRWYVIEASFDSVDRITRATTGATSGELLGSGGESAVTFGYAKNGALYAAGSSYGPLITSLVHDADGMPTSRTYGDAAATTTSYLYDARRRLEIAETSRLAPSIWTSPPSGYVPPADKSTLQLLLQRNRFTYDEAGNPLTIADERIASEWPAGSKPVTRTFTYDDLYRLRSVSFAYPGGDGLWVSPFDAENRGLTGDAPKPSPHVAFGSRPQQQRYTYDWLGNTSASGDDANGFYDRSLGTITNNLAQSKPYQLTKASNRALGGDGARRGDLDVAYDATGNLIALVVRRDGPCLPTGASCWQRFAYTWDEASLLASAKRWDLTPAERPANGPLTSPPPSRAPDAELRHAYGAEGQRTRKTALDPAGNARHTLYVFSSLELRSTSFADAAGDYERDGTTERPYLLVGGARLASIVPGDGLPSLTPGSPPHVFLTVGDHLGSTALVVDLATSELVEQNGYQAYGGAESALRPGRWQSQREPYRFTGKEDDLEVGLQYFGARYYAPLLGRWLSPDPLAVHELGDDPNLYAYVHGRALVAVDPNGQFAWIPFLIGVAVTLAVNAYVQDQTIRNGEQQGFSWGSFLIAGVSAAAGGAVGAVAGPALGAAAGKLLGSAAWGVAVGTLGGGAVGGLAGGTTARAGRGIAEGRAADEVLADTFAPGNLAMDAGLGMGSAAVGYAAGQALGWVRGAARGGEAATSGGRTSTAPGGAGPGAVAVEKSLPKFPPPTQKPSTASVASPGEGKATSLAASPALEGSGVSSGAPTTDGYRIIDGVHRARAAARLDLGEIEAEIYKSDRLVGRMKVDLDQLRSMKPSIDLSFRWQRALEEVSTGASAPIKIEAAPGGVPIRAVQLKKP